MIREIIVTPKIHKFYNYLSKLNWKNYQCENGYLFVDCPKLFSLLLDTCTREQKQTIDVNEAYLRFLFEHIATTNRKSIILFLPETGVWIYDQELLLLDLVSQNSDKEFIVYTNSPDMIGFYGDKVIYV
jgi:hypothetical protein